MKSQVQGWLISLPNVIFLTNHIGLKYSSRNVFSNSKEIYMLRNLINMNFTEIEIIFYPPTNYFFLFQISPNLLNLILYINSSLNLVKPEVSQFLDPLYRKWKWFHPGWSQTRLCWQSDWRQSWEKLLTSIKWDFIVFSRHSKCPASVPHIIMLCSPSLI